MKAFLGRTEPDLQYPLLVMAFLVFLIVGTFWLYIRPDFGVLAAIRRHLGAIGLGFLIIASALVVLYVIAPTT